MNDIKKRGFEERMNRFLEYMSGEFTVEKEFSFIKKINKEMNLSEEETIYACLLSIATGDWDMNFPENKRGEVTRYTLRNYNLDEILKNEYFSHKLEKDLSEKYCTKAFKKGNHRNRLQADHYHCTKFNKIYGGPIVTTITSFHDSLPRNQSAVENLQGYKKNRDPFDNAFKYLKKNIKLFGPLASFDFLQSLNYALGYSFFKPSYIYSKKRGDNGGVPKGMKYLLWGNKEYSWNDIRMESHLSSNEFNQAVKDVEVELIDAARKNLDWDEKRLVFDVESCLCNYQKPF